MKKGRVNKGRNVKLMSADLLEFLQEPFEVPVGDAIDRVVLNEVSQGDLSCINALGINAFRYNQNSTRDHAKF
jgi:hypothetical protein